MKFNTVNDLAILSERVIERANGYCANNRAILKPLLTSLLRCEDGFEDLSSWDDSDPDEPEPEIDPAHYLSKEEQAELAKLEREAVRNQILLHTATLRRKVAEQNIELARLEALPPPEPTPPKPAQPQATAPAAPPAASPPEPPRIEASDNPTPHREDPAHRRNRTRRRVHGALRPLPRRRRRRTREHSHSSSRRSRPQQ
ncbi:MAG: hypothetical protein IPK80_15895 [Nannocystis sp.]|nr:hypothetical protein [Nannocystis sp.]